MKLLAAHPPEYFPGIPFFLKMILADKFVIADDLQFSTRSSVNRTKIRTSDGWQWLTVPVLSKGKLLQRINDVQILPDTPWQRKHLRTIQANYKYASFYEHYSIILEQILEKRWKSLLELNNETINILKSQLKIDTPIFYSSNIDFPKKGSEKIIQIVKYYNCDHYLITEEELCFVDNKLLYDNGINLIVKKLDFPNYYQQFEPFEKNMSVLDLLLNAGIESRKIILSGFE